MIGSIATIGIFGIAFFPLGSEGPAYRVAYTVSMCIAAAAVIYKISLL
jgi:hypothetical protein